MPVFSIQGQTPYIVEDVDRISTPRLVVFMDRVKRNVERMKASLEEVVPGSGFGHLSPHVKTHKSEFITRFLLDQGIRSFKATPNEAEMAARAGAPDVFIAYPLLAKDALRVMEWTARHPGTRFSVQIGSKEHAALLEAAGTPPGGVWHVFIDIDVGMNRTGADPGHVLELYRNVFQRKGFSFAGLHAYDGHNHHTDPVKRAAEAVRSMDRLFRVFEDMTKSGIDVPAIVVAGSPTYRLDLGLVHEMLGQKTLLFVSPGTWVYWDTEYDRLFPGAFEFAALLLAQVIDTGPKGRVTINLGHKRWGADRGPLECFNLPDAKVVSFSEEHTVLGGPSVRSCRINDFVLAVPRHVCSTVNLYESFVLVGENGRILDLRSPVDARNR